MNKRRATSTRIRALKRRYRLKVPKPNKHFLLALFTVASLSALMMIHVLPDRVRLQPGDRSPVTIRASRSVSYTDTEATQRLRENLASQVHPVYQESNNAIIEAVRAVDDATKAIRQARANHNGGTLDEKALR